MWKYILMIFCTDIHFCKSLPRWKSDSENGPLDSKLQTGILRRVSRFHAPLNILAGTSIDHLQFFGECNIATVIHTKDWEYSYKFCGWLSTDPMLGQLGVQNLFCIFGLLWTIALPLSGNYIWIFAWCSIIWTTTSTYDHIFGHLHVTFIHNNLQCILHRRTC